MIGGEALQFVQRVQCGDGQTRLYFRKKGHARRALKGAWGTSELEAEVRAILAAETAPKALPGTLRVALRAYELEDADFKSLATSTKYIYRLFLKEFDDDLGAVAIPRFTPSYILELRNAWAIRGHRAANQRMQVLKNVLWPSVIAGQIEGGDPFALIGQVRRPHELGEPHVIWPDKIVHAVITVAIERKRYGLARAVALARWTGARRGDLVKMEPRIRQDGRVRFLSGKRKVAVDIREDPALTAWLGATPETQPATPRQGRKVKPAAPGAAIPLRKRTLVYNLSGSPYTDQGLGAELEGFVADLASAGLVDSTAYDLHGLRHTRGVELAIAGCTDAEGAAMMGQRDPRSFAQYRRQADRIGLSANGDDKVTVLRERRANGPV